MAIVTKDILPSVLSEWIDSLESHFGRGVPERLVVSRIFNYRFTGRKRMEQEAMRAVRMEQEAERDNGILLVICEFS